MYENVPLYHDWFRARNLLPEEIKTTDQLRLLPVLTRQTIEDNYPGRILSVKARIENVVRRTTSGTTGKPLEVLWDNEYCDTISSLRLLSVWFTGTSHLAKTVEIQYFGSDSPEPRRRSASRRARKILFGPMVAPKLLTLRASKMGFRKSITEVEEELLRIHPAAVESRPSYLRRLGLHLKNGGRTLGVKKIVSDGEYLSKQVREDLADLFQAEVFDFYGANELGPLALECGAHAGKHLNMDYFVFEFLKNGEPVSPGEQAEVLITPLYNKTMPLLRYRVGDLVIPDSDDSCECGLHLPRLKEVLGRPNDGLVLPDGTQIPTGVVVDYIEDTVRLREYQLIQTARNSILLKLKEEQDVLTVRTLVSTYLKSLFGDDLGLSVETWKEDDIPPKYRPVIRRFAA